MELSITRLLLSHIFCFWTSRDVLIESVELVLVADSFVLHTGPIEDVYLFKLVLKFILFSRILFESLKLRKFLKLVVF